MLDSRKRSNSVRRVQLDAMNRCTFLVGLPVDDHWQHLQTYVVTGRNGQLWIHCGSWEAVAPTGRQDTFKSMHFAPARVFFVFCTSILVTVCAKNSPQNVTTRTVSSSCSCTGNITPRVCSMTDWYAELVGSCTALGPWPLDICRIVANYASRAFKPWLVCQPEDVSHASALHACSIDSICVVRAEIRQVTRICSNSDTVSEPMNGVVSCYSEKDSVFIVDADNNLVEHRYIEEFGLGRYHRCPLQLANVRTWCSCCGYFPHPSCTRSVVVGINPAAQSVFCFKTKLDEDGDGVSACLEQLRFRTAQSRETVTHTWGGLGRGVGEFLDVSAIAKSPDGKVVYILDTLMQRIQAFRSDGGRTDFLFGWRVPEVMSMVVDSETGDVYTGDRLGWVCVFDCKGGRGCRYSLAGPFGSCPILLAAGDAGRVFAFPRHASNTTIYHLV